MVLKYLESVHQFPANSLTLLQILPSKQVLQVVEEVLDSAAHSSLLAVDPVKYVNKMSNGQMLP